MNELEVKRLQNEIMYLKEDNHLLVARVEELKDELATKNFLLEKSFVDAAIAHQQINHLKEQGELQIVQIEKIKKVI